MPTRAIKDDGVGTAWYRIVSNVYEVPESLQQQWSARSYHGSVEHNSRAVINRYLGYWDGNPTTLIPLSPEDSAPLYVEMMGGAEPILAKGKALYDEGMFIFEAHKAMWRWDIPLPVPLQILH